MMVDVEDECSRLTNMKLSLEETVEQVWGFCSTFYSVAVYALHKKNVYILLNTPTYWCDP